ncbi:MAG: hypothetical protein OJF48_000995 [Afipia sp.]|nr:MAG: hypothetical protein OJF48_000995 [Afipia sp.]
MTTTPFADGPRRVIPAHRLRAKGQDDAVAPRTEGDGRVRQSTQRWCTQHRPPGVPHAASRSNHCVRNAGCNRRDRGDYARVLFTFAHGAADALAHPAFRAPSFRAKRREEFGRPRAVITTGAMARDRWWRGLSLARTGQAPRATPSQQQGRWRTSASASCLKTESGEDGARDRATLPMSSPRKRGPITTKRYDDEGKSCPAPNNTMVQGVWVPAFAGTTGERSRGRRESVRGHAKRNRDCSPAALTPA